MITRLKVNNYKSLWNLDMPLTPFTVIVGNNATGKSSILQVLQFLFESVANDFKVVVENRGLSVENIKSKYANHGIMTFQLELSLPIEQEQRDFVWNLEIRTTIKDNKMELWSERIYDVKNGKVLLEFLSGKYGILVDSSNNNMDFPMSVNSSSLLKYVDISSDLYVKNYPELCAIKRYCLDSDSYELLNPTAMRSSSRGKVSTIGSYGENLPSFIKGMNETQKKDFQKKIQMLLGTRIENVEAYTKGKPGWTQLRVTEKYGNDTIKITSKDLSDGTLRVLAFIALLENEKSETTLLLDEIENGINLNYAEKLVALLQQAYAEKKQQLIVTTHSTVFLDYVDRDNIIYLYRDEDTGFTKAAKLFDVEEMKSKLEYMYPGEVLLNITNDEIVKILMENE